uniref:DUF8039 domain-containing protein n=1 Tax=Oryza glaberrima TaxID=4538 RepID=I1P2C3_ORYGL
MSQQREAMSTTTSKSSRARTPRTGNKIPKERFCITAVDAVGLPTSPRKILSRFRSICGVIGRQKLSILQVDIKLVPAAEKDIAWLTFKESFDYPAEHEDRLRARSEAYHLLQTRNQHPHRLGTTGYAGKEDEWQGEDEEAEELNTPLVFGDIPHPWARNWARARYQKNDDGTIFMPNAKDQRVYEAIEPTSCTLTVRVMPTFMVPAAEGLAYKPTPETRVHGAQLRADCAKVQVDSVKPEYELFPLKYPSNDEVHSLGNARGTFIQWPKNLIEIRLQYDMNFGEDQTEADSKAIHEPPPMKKSRKAHSSSQRITLDKPEAKGRGRRGKVQASLLAPRKLDLGKVQEETKGKEVKKKYVAPQEFQLGMPLVGDDVLAAMGTACKYLHLYYMENSNVRKPNKATDILGEYDGKPFLGPTNYIMVDFKDLFDLYRLRAMDTSLLKCYSLLSWQWCQKHALEVAFLDPQVVTVTNLQNDRQGMVNYIYDTLWSRRDKEYIMCAYNQYAHWILLVITPKWTRIDKNAYDWTPIQLAIDEAWAQYVQRGGLRKTGYDTLIHKKDFPVKQQIGD